MTQEKIEDAIVQFVMQNGRHPRFVLLDKASYDRFNESFTPKEAIKTNIAEDVEIKTVFKIKAICTQPGITVDILSVDNKDTSFFEVV